LLKARRLQLPMENGRSRFVFKLKKWVDHPVAILKDMAHWLTTEYKKEDTLAIALTNENSIFVPLAEVRKVETGKKLTQGNFIKVHTLARTAIICQDMASENQFQGLFSMFSSNWQSGLISKLQEVARRNT
jgi:hypothetical protein